MAAGLKFRRLPRVDSGTFWIGYHQGSDSPIWIRWAGPGEGLMISVGSMFVPMESDVARSAYAKMTDAEKAIREFEKEVSQ